jgi:SAM domain (Sterile alpha motif)
MDVTEWLRSLGLEHYAPAFEQNHISPELLPSLTAEDLKELGVASVGHRRQMLEAIAALRAAPKALLDELRDCVGVGVDGEAAAMAELGPSSAKLAGIKPALYRA